MKSRISALSKAGGIASEDKAGDLRGRKVWSKSPGYPGAYRMHRALIPPVKDDLGTDIFLVKC